MERGGIELMASAFDPVEFNKAQRAANMNHATLPVIHKMRTQTLGEFCPELWNEIKHSTVARVVATKVYNAIRKRMDGV